MFIVKNIDYNFLYYLTALDNNVLIWDRRRDKAKIFTDPILKELFLKESYTIEEI